MKLSIIIPVHNEAGCIEQTVTDIEQTFLNVAFDYEIIVINDGSEDTTEDVLKAITVASETTRYVNNSGPKGFGFAVRRGLDAYTGDAVVIVMGDGSDSPKDILNYYNKLCEGFDCVFGSRFITGGWTKGYPRLKYVLNRCANNFISWLFRIPFNDVTSSFKCYRREVIDSFRPFISGQFNLTVELPLKAVIRRYEYAVVPVGWTNRDHGKSKFRIKEIGSAYFLVIWYLYFEKLLTAKDPYRKREETSLQA